MSKVAVVYWSGTGNTQTMASAVADGAKGAEVLEESEFDPMFTAVESALAGKKIGLFGSYGWGDGQWMRDWEDGVIYIGAVTVLRESVIRNFELQALLFRDLYDTIRLANANTKRDRL